MVRREGIGSQVDVKFNGWNTTFGSSIMWSCSCSVGNGSPQKDVKMRVGVELRTFGEMKMFIARSLSLCVKSESYNRVVL